MLQIKRYKKLKTKDISKLERKEKQVFGEGALNRFYLPVIARCGALFALIVDGEIEGVASFIYCKKGAFLVGFWVGEKYRRKGFGLKLLKKTMLKLKNEGIEMIELTVKESNKTALSLYKKAGFSEKENLHNFYGEDESRLLLKIQI